MKHQTFELILISPPGEYPQETEWVNKIFAKGLGTFHLRKPGWGSAQLLHYLKGVEAQYHSRIMVHYQEEVRDDIEVKGIHYHNHFLPLQKPAFQVSCGLHSWSGLLEAASRIDYAFISPFYNSISKEGYPAKQELWHVPEGVGRAKAVALGGIEAGNIQQIKSLGLKGAAVLGAVWKAADPVEAFLELENMRAD